MPEITREELAEWRSVCEAATPGPWYAHYTDDNMCMCAMYISTEPGEGRHDNLRGMDIDDDTHRPDPKTVRAITLLQSPRLVGDGDVEAGTFRAEEDTAFIAAVRDALPRLIARVEELEAAMREFCGRVDIGEARSVRTYAKFKALLGGDGKGR